MSQIRWTFPLIKEWKSIIFINDSDRKMSSGTAVIWTQLRQVAFRIVFTQIWRAPAYDEWIESNIFIGCNNWYLHSHRPLAVSHNH